MRICAVNVLRYFINPLVSWLVTHGELEVLSPEVVRGLVTDVFQNPEKGERVGDACCEGWASCCSISVHRGACGEVEHLFGHHLITIKWLQSRLFRWPERTDSDGAGAALHHPDPARPCPLPRAPQRAHSVWLASTALDTHWRKASGVLCRCP